MTKFFTAKTSSRMLLVVTGFLAMVFLMSFTLATNFSGEWTFNQEKSVFPTPPAGAGGGGGGGGGQGGGFGGGRGGAGASLKITQDASTITIATTRNFQGNESVTTEKITLDGKESVNEIAGFQGNTTTRKSTATWSADGKNLVIVNIQPGRNGGEQKTTSEYSLSADGKMLMVKTTRTTQNGEVVTTFAYDKKG